LSTLSAPDKLKALIKTAFDMDASPLNLHPPGVRTGRLRISLAVLLGVLVAWTALIVTGVLPPSFMWARARLPVETAGVLVLSLLSALAYIRYSLTGAPSQLFLALAFVNLASTRLVLGVILPPGTLGITADKALYLWMPGRVFAGLLLVGAAFRSSALEREHPHRLREFLVSAAIVGVGLLPVELVVWTARHDLPLLSHPGASGLLSRLSSGRLPAVTTTDVLLGLALTCTYLVAAYGFWRRAEESDSSSSWYLVLALPVAAFAQFHNMLLPTMPADRISSADALGVLFWATLLIGQIVEVRDTYFSERARARELASAYETERERVRDLEQVDRDKAELAQLLTHDFLHAVAAMRSYAVTLARRWPDLSDDLRLEVAQWMERETGRLRDLAEQGVFVLEARGGKVLVRPKPERAADLAREAADAVDHLGGRLQVMVPAGSEGLMVLADRTRVLQVARNLLANADSYSEPGTPVGFEVAATATDVVFSVKDKGPGIPPELIGLLFRQFSRLPGAERDGSGGSGLGLYISRQIVEAHGGRIWVESKVGEGSSFSFSLARVKDAG
jgi:signal transduction histidine kinase